MIIRSLTSIFIFLVTLSFSAFARQTVPVIEHINIPIETGSGRTATMQQVHDAISSAASANQWEISKPNSTDLIVATLRVRGKHTVVVSIPYASDLFSIKYQNSDNMKYEITKGAPGSFPGAPNQRDANQIKEGTTLIHPFYNKWVGVLLSSIQAEFKKI